MADETGIFETIGLFARSPLGTNEPVSRRAFAFHEPVPQRAQDKGRF
jgi:hypothetical protein